MEESKNDISIFRSLSVLHRHGMIYLKRNFVDDEIKNSYPPFLLMIIKNEGISQEELARKLRFDKGAIARIVRIMSENGYIIREKDPQDKRKYNLYVSEKGRAIMPRIKKIENEYEKTITRGMTEEQKLVLQSLLQKASENLLEATKNKSAADDGSCDRSNPFARINHRKERRHK